jgi:hypothetical protein
MFLEIVEYLCDSAPVIPLQSEKLYFYKNFFCLFDSLLFVCPNNFQIELVKFVRLFYFSKFILWFCEGILYSAPSFTAWSESSRHHSWLEVWKILFTIHSVTGIMTRSASLSLTQGVECSSAPLFIAYSELLRHHSWHTVWFSATSFMKYSKLLRHHSWHTVNFCAIIPCIHWTGPLCIAYSVNFCAIIHAMQCEILRHH